MKCILFFLLLFCTKPVFCHELRIKRNLEQILKKELLDVSDIRSVSVLIMDAESTTIIDSISFVVNQKKYTRCSLKNIIIPGTALARSVNYITFLRLGIKPREFYVDTGLYEDSISTCQIMDDTYSHGGIGRASVYTSFLYNSTTGFIKAADTIYEKKMWKYKAALKRLGLSIFHSDLDFESEEPEDHYDFWNPCEIMGIRKSPLSMFEYCNSSREMICHQEGEQLLLSSARDSLISIMRDNTLYGLGCFAKSNRVSLGTITDVSPTDVNGCRMSTCTAVLPYDQPSFLISVAVERRSEHFGTAIPCRIARKIAELFSNLYFRHFQ